MLCLFAVSICFDPWRHYLSLNSHSLSLRCLCIDPVPVVIFCITLRLSAVIKCFDPWKCCFVPFTVFLCFLLVAQCLILHHLSSVLLCIDPLYLFICFHHCSIHCGSASPFCLLTMLRSLAALCFFSAGISLPNSGSLRCPTIIRFIWGSLRGPLKHFGQFQRMLGNSEMSTRAGSSAGR